MTNVVDFSRYQTPHAAITSIPEGAISTIAAPKVKRQLRRELKHIRAQVPMDTRDTASWMVANHIRRLIAVHRPSIVALYWPLDGEIPLGNLVKDLHHNNDLGVELALPRVAYKGGPLVFNKWYPGARLDYDKLGITAAVGPEVQPGLIIMPCLGFDRHGMRLGYGGGYYDKTIKNMRFPAITCGVAYSDQEVSEIPHEYHDQPLDYIATERQLILCR